MTEPDDPHRNIDRGAVLRASIVVTGLMLALNFLIPPWSYVMQRGNVIRVMESAGYRLVFLPPEPLLPGGPYGVRIDTPRLALQTLAILSVLLTIRFVAAARLPRRSANTGS